MKPTWKSVHLPAATKWVRTREDARRYYETSAHDICTIIDGKPVVLSELDPVERQAWVNIFLRRWDEDRWLATTKSDADDAMKRARLMAGPGEKPMVGVQTSKGVIFQARVPKKGK